MTFTLHTNHRYAANRVLCLTLFAIFCASMSLAQTVRPVISEYTAKVAKGSIELVNPSATPLTVIMEPKSFTVSSTGDIAYRPLDKNIQVKLSATSFQIPPQQSHFVFYEARADVLPVWFVIYADIGGYKKTSEGMNVRLDLPHTVYILPKQSASKSEIQVQSLGLSDDKTRRRFSVTNSGPWFGRVLGSQLAGKGNSWQGSGFPVYPHGVRIVEVPCKAILPNAELRLRLKNFTLAEPVFDAAESAACAP